MPCCRHHFRGERSRTAKLEDGEGIARTENNEGGHTSGRTRKELDRETVRAATGTGAEDKEVGKWGGADNDGG